VQGRLACVSVGAVAPADPDIQSIAHHKLVAVLMMMMMMMMMTMTCGGCGVDDDDSGVGLDGGGVCMRA